MSSANYWIKAAREADHRRNVAASWTGRNASHSSDKARYEEAEKTASYYVTELQSRGIPASAGYCCCRQCDPR